MLDNCTGDEHNATHQEKETLAGALVRQPEQQRDFIASGKTIAPHQFRNVALAPT